MFYWWLLGNIQRPLWFIYAVLFVIRDGVNQLPVMAGDQLQGVLGRGDVISLLRTMAEFSRR